jgi:hypothetical protein
MRDWRSESGKMASVYTNAVMTIAIDSSEDSDGGCFRPIDLAKSLPGAIRLEGTLSNGMPTTLIVPEIIDAMKGGDFDTGPKALTRAPLSTRAWAYQERILSPRIVHFTNDTLIWECRKEYQSLWNILSPPTPNGVIRDAKKRTLLDRWYLEVVLEYSGRHLTFETDKLPALAGLARIFHALLQLPYLAGIWVDPDNIGHALSWKPVCPNMFNLDEYWRTTNDSGCPTWSWASMACGASYNGSVANEETCKGKKGPLEQPRLVDFGCVFPFGDAEENLVCLVRSSDGDWDAINALPMDPFGKIKSKSAWLEVKGCVREAIIADVCDAPRRGWRKVQAKDGTSLGTVDMSIAFTGNADILLLCLYDEGSFVNALALIGINDGVWYARVGLALITTRTRVEDWESKTVILG